VGPPITSPAKGEKELGSNIKWSEKVQAADFGRVMREYATGGYDAC